MKGEGSCWEIEVVVVEEWFVEQGWGFLDLEVVEG